MNGEVMLISDNQVKQLLSMEDTIATVEETFKAKSLGKTQMPPKTYLTFERYDGDIRVMPSYLESLDSAGVKIVNVHPHNPTKYGIPTVMAIIILVNPKNGSVVAIIDGTYITSMRTGAAGAVATKYMARKDSKTLGLVGAGVQAKTQLMAISKILKLEEVRVWSTPESTIDTFIHEEEKLYNFNFYHCKNCDECVSRVDVLSTTTPSTVPVIDRKWVLPGTHINAIGADAPGKEELDPKILLDSRIVVDDLTQAIHSGEINLPISKGIINLENIYGELGEVVSGKKIGRYSNEEITVFDSTGLSVLDVSTATLVYNRAIKNNFGTLMRFH